MCGSNDCTEYTYGTAYGRDYCCDTIERCITIYGLVRKCEVTSKLTFYRYAKFTITALKYIRDILYRDIKIDF